MRRTPLTVAGASFALALTLAACGGDDSGDTPTPTAGGGDAKFVWVDAEFLGRQGGVDLPIWAPYAGESRGFHTWSNAAATKAGLTFRPIATTCKDTLAWYRGLPQERQAKLRAGMSAEREAELLAKFRAG